MPSKEGSNGLRELLLCFNDIARYQWLFIGFQYICRFKWLLGEIALLAVAVAFWGFLWLLRLPSIFIGLQEISMASQEASAPSLPGAFNAFIEVLCVVHSFQVLSTSSFVLNLDRDLVFDLNLILVMVLGMHLDLVMVIDFN